ncbi:MAG: HlyD family efflux transporter periplasmic adaptor subunit [Acidovorax sp.]|nr:HlyD family efflux transporter periplasmic adaptor subunit [Acidovorax sp.]
MNASITTGRVHPAALLLELGHRARLAATVQELEFLLVNDTRLLQPYRQAVWWTHQGGVQALSGVVQPDRNVPYAQWVAQVCRHMVQQQSAACVLTAVDLPPDLAAQWAQWWPAHAVWLPMQLKSQGGAVETAAAGLLLAGPEPVPADRLPLLAEWSSMWIHAWQALQRQHLGSPRQWWARLRQQQAQRAWWRRPAVWAVCALLVLAAWPVHLTVLAPGELVAAQPVVLRAPMDGVVEQIHVQPNEMVSEGQLLFSLDEAQIASRLEVSQQALQTAEAEYRQFAQLALGDMRSKSQLAALAGKIGERRAEQAFLTEQRLRAQMLAPRAGMVLFDAPTEWIGKPVQTGERVMRIAQPDVVEVEAWLPIGDAIPLQVGAPVQLYLAADPLAAVQARVRYMAYDAVVRPDGAYAYRVRAELLQPGAQRIGLKGTAKLQGERVSLAYWMVRKPWASIRQWVAL